MKLSLYLLGAITLGLCGCEKSKPVETPSSTTLAPRTSIPTSEAPPLPPTPPPAEALPPPQPPQAENRPALDPAERNRQRLEDMQTSLNLTPEQAEKVKAILEAQRPAMTALWTDTSLTREARREKMQVLRQEVDRQMATVLTPEQAAKWEAERAQRRERRGQGGNPPPPVPAPPAPTEAK